MYRWCCNGCIPCTVVFLLYCRVLLFRTEEDVKNANVSVGTEPVDWSSPEGHALLHLLLPSADVINFRIAHEVAHLKRHDIWWNAVLSPVFLVGGYHIAVLVCKSKYHNNTRFPPELQHCSV